MSTVFMIRDKTTLKYWNGQNSWSRFGDSGKQWKKKAACEASLGYFYRYHSRYRQDELKKLDNWEIVEVDVTPTVKNQTGLDSLLRHLKIRKELEDTHANLSFSSFMSRMRDKGCDDDIEYIMELEPTPGMWRVDGERIKEARAQIRGLGIKTRTFREYNGMFGFLDRQQALRARLSLNAKQVVDVAAIRKKIDEA